MRSNPKLNMKRTFRLSHAEARRLAAECCLSSPEGYIVRVSEPTRTLEQNSLLWELLSRVSEQVDWYGQKLTAEDWKEVFSASLKKQKVVPGLDGGFVVCGRSTSKMTKGEFSELIELIHAFAAQQGVEINERVAA